MLVYPFTPRRAGLTREYWRFYQLHKFVDLDKDVDRHLKFGTVFLLVKSNHTPSS